LTALPIARCAVAHPRLANGDQADAGDDLALWKIVLTHNAWMALLSRPKRDEDRVVEILQDRSRQFHATLTVVTGIFQFRSQPREVYPMKEPK
jgi:hypothetical protein